MVTDVVGVLVSNDYHCRVVTKADAPYIKMVSEQFDSCHGTLLQYVEFLCSSVTPASAYAQLIPSLDDLVHRYHLDPEVCLYGLPNFEFSTLFQSVVVPTCNSLKTLPNA